MAVSGKHLARWYRELAQHLTAGFPLQKALVAAGGVPLADRKRLAEGLGRGDPFRDILFNAPRWLPEADRHVLAAAAETGRLVEGLRVLSEKHAAAAGHRAKAASAAAYPLFIVHFGVFMVPLKLLISDGLETYLRLVASILLPLWALLAVVFWGARRRHRWLRWVMAVIPFVRGYHRYRSIADLCFTLGAYLAAGASVDTSWAGAGRASGSRRLAGLGRRVAGEARDGTAPSVVLEKSGALPEEFVALYTTGEHTGQLEENLHHLGVFYSERADARLQQASFWYPKLAFLAVVLAVAYVAISGYYNYLQEVLQMLE